VVPVQGFHGIRVDRAGDQDLHSGPEYVSYPYVTTSCGFWAPSRE
jgi:hypothetical protein